MLIWTAFSNRSFKRPKKLSQKKPEATNVLGLNLVARAFFVSLSLINVYQRFTERLAGL